VGIYTSPAAPTAADDLGLVPAEHPICDVGAQILRYLATGDNGGDPVLDQLFASEVGSSKPQARALIDQYITQCDQRQDQDIAASSSSAAAAVAESSYEAAATASRAAASASAAALAAQQQRSCAAIGGQSDGSRCQSASQGNVANDSYFPCSSVYVEYTEEGTIDQVSLHDVTTDHPGCFR
jgi:hypothetical protein